MTARIAAPMNTGSAKTPAKRFRISLPEKFARMPRSLPGMNAGAVAGEQLVRGRRILRVVHGRDAAPRETKEKSAQLAD